MPRPASRYASCASRTSAWSRRDFFARERSPWPLPGVIFARTQRWLSCHVAIGHGSCSTSIVNCTTAMSHPDRFLLAGVMGDPVMHSRSPKLHNYWLAKYGLAGTYVPLAITAERLR